MASFQAGHQEQVDHFERLVGFVHHCRAAGGGAGDEIGMFHVETAAVGEVDPVRLKRFGSLKGEELFNRHDRGSRRRVVWAMQDSNTLRKRRGIRRFPKEAVRNPVHSAHETPPIRPRMTRPMHPPTPTWMR